MACPHKRKALKLLLGELGGGASTQMLEHCRVCGECREAFDFAASTITKTACVSGSAVAARATEVQDDVPRGADPDARVRFATRRNRRTLFVFAALGCVALVAGVGKARGGGDVPSEPPEASWKRALAEGTPVVTSPRGSFGERPRVVTALVPPGASSFVTIWFDDAGRVVLERPVKPGDAGCFVDDAEVSAPTGAFRAGRLVAPFPEEAALPLTPGRAWGVAIAIGGGHASAASPFVTAPPSAPLHDGPREER